MLVSAPAGFGKTTLLADWLAAVTDATDGETATAWLSLDAGDNDPRRSGPTSSPRCGRSRPGSARSALALLQEPQPPPIQLVLTTLLNDLGARGAPTSSCCSTTTTSSTRVEVHAGMEFLLDHLPAPAAPGDRQPGRPGPAAAPGCAHAASSSRSGPPTCASPPTRRRPTSTTSMGLQLTPDDVTRPGGAHRGLDRGAPARGALDDRDATTPPPSSPASRATTATSSTTWSRRSCSASPSRSRRSCCRPPSSTG